MREEVTIFDFNKTSNRKQWDLVNDEVMGGISMGLLQIDDDGNGAGENRSLEEKGKRRKKKEKSKKPLY